MAAPHVLLVDPSPLRDVLAERIRMQGFAVTAAPDAATGAHLALSDPPAIVIADLWMPGISGVQLCRLLRSEPATESVPIILRGPEQRQRDRFWAERAGAAAYVASGRMGDLVRALTRALAESPPPADTFFTQLSGGELDLRDRIASHLDTALFESVIASEVRALSVCGTFARLFDLLSQLVAQVTSYRWLAVYTARPARLGLHAHPAVRPQAEAEARQVLGVPDHVPVVCVEDEDAWEGLEGPPALVEEVRLGAESLGRLALAARHPSDRQDQALARVIAQELGGPIRIATLMEESERLAMVDPLTGLLNRRAFAMSAHRELARMERTGEPLSVFLIDVDHFKQVNDTRGHATGDTVLAAVGALLPRTVRANDLVGRWGGEEFVVALTGSLLGPAALRAEEVRKAIAALDVRGTDGRPVPLTASIGVAAFRPGDTLDSVVERADRAMYAAKAAGRNRVEVEPVPTLELLSAPVDRARVAAR
ncbi:MAG: diguanylate cyclase [Pseudomonadota bacterium]|nr:diguanylate cyclase [Pseudomonadota bacterium]